ncbi:hypothetical protein ACIQ9K_23825 [Streptomyces microflavus]|uniref:hypothetical protein n=1 Tax=Streptomyces TaxID=1883 RepID=UPI000823F27A|nr:MULTISPECIES: hypothetical protein [Streptomyces]WSA65189.1 hypothetical protein OHB31_02045 [Streptomyces microflavus]SCK34645.1 hypothetical protein YUYDRAFT_04096 [Streptomyces sp. ScaeMP-e48]
MHASQPLRVPVGTDAGRWSTFHGEKTLVVAARTVTSTVRVLECLPALLRGDRRVTVVFAHDPTSAFNDGVLDLLHDAGCRVIPWEQVGHAEPDLILTASENIDVPDGHCPVLVLPHGIGFQKQVPDSRASGDRLSGVVPDSLLESGRAWLAISHPGQEEQLLSSHPKAAGRTLLVGDPCYDELLGSAGRAGAYRTALGVPDAHRLVVLSSTWGPTSLIGQDPGLAARLLAALPYDEFRVAAIVHPNVWSGHGSWQIRNLLAPALDAGLMLVPHIHAWRSALVAAEVVVGDHGSVTLYGAALGKPVLLGAFGSEAVPGTAVAALGRAAPRLDAHGDMHGQIASALTSRRPELFATIAEGAFDQPGRALPRLRAALYDLLRLPEPVPAPPQERFLAEPEKTGAQATAWTVTTTGPPGDGPDAVTVRRHPAAVSWEEADGGEDEVAGRFRHLACDEREPDRRLLESASVLLRGAPARSAAAGVRWIGETLDRLPGCRLAAAALAGGGALVGLRDGRVVEAAMTGPATDPGLPAAAVYALLRAAAPLDGALVALRVGAREEDVALRLRTAPPPGSAPR